MCCITAQALRHQITSVPLLGVNDQVRIKDLNSAHPVSQWPRSLPGTGDR